MQDFDLSDQSSDQGVEDVDIDIDKNEDDNKHEYDCDCDDCKITKMD